MATGPGALATGPGALATGPGALATGPGALATGPGALATGPGALATGPGALATGPGALATGPGATVCTAGCMHMLPNRAHFIRFRMMQSPCAHQAEPFTARAELVYDTMIESYDGACDVCTSGNPFFTSGIAAGSPWNRLAAGFF
ncbi:hypothetical protein [Candidatus Chloroploca asiatica]|uniref:hypothetical protein n=1 Tax=Candidatus Chloroploca asiatica TaxID=1506545 RepID=UPI003CCBCAA1